MIVTVASGKGGTGKTSIAVNMALSIGNCQVLDCNVEKPNAHLLLPAKISRAKFVFASTVKVNDSLCSQCGECSKLCKYSALSSTGNTILVFPELCHGCGECITICPQKAISEENCLIGTLNFYKKGNIELIYGELEAGKPMAVPVIKAVKKQAEKNRTVIIDSPSGAPHSFEASVRNSDYCILVTEPAPSGLQDLKSTVEILKKMDIPYGVVVNHANIDTKTVYDYCKQENISVLLEIPYEERIAELHSKGVAFSVEMPQWKTSFQNLFDQLKTLTGN